MTIEVQYEESIVTVSQPDDGVIVLTQDDINPEVINDNYENIVLDMRMTNPVTGEMVPDLSLNTLYKVVEEVLENSDKATVHASSVIVNPLTIDNSTITGTNVQTVLEQQETKIINGGYF